MELREKGSNETDGGFFVREDPDDALPASDLFVEPFLGVGTSKRTRYFLGKASMFIASSNPSSRHSMALGAFFSTVRRISFRTVRASSIVSERNSRERAWASGPLWEAGA